MKTPMVIFNDVMKKKNKKNRKGFSLVELIVVLVIMAILAAALIPSLMGYISKTKEQNINSECQSAVQAAQTIASGAYASADGNYVTNGKTIKWADVHTGSAIASGDYVDAIKLLAEVPNAATISVTVSNTTSTDGRVLELSYTRDSITIKYELDTTTLVGKYSKA